MLLWTFITGLLGVGRTVALGLTALSFVVGIAGAYMKGRSDCSAKYETAELKAQLADQARQINELNEAMQFGKELADTMDKIEKADAETEKNIPSSVARAGCDDPGFVRWLDTLR